MAGREDLRAPLEAMLQQLVARYDDFLPWDRYIRTYGYQKEWNTSQAYFNLPLLE